MPAATTTTTVASEPLQSNVWYRPSADKVLESFSPPITAAEHKIRNLEKRKLKLDQYRTEQAEGKTLNADQLAAVSKYNEVIQQLEHNRELVSCLRHVHQQTIKFIKQELRREFAERNKFMLSVYAGLDQLHHPNVQHDFMNGENGALKLREEDVEDLAELSKLLKPSIREPDFAAKVETGAEVVAKLFESRGKVNNKPSQVLKTLLDSIVESQYFRTSLATAVPIESVKEVVAPSQETPITVHVPEIPMAHNSNPVSAQVMINQVLNLLESQSYDFEYFNQYSNLKTKSPWDDQHSIAESLHTPAVIESGGDESNLLLSNLTRSASPVSSVAYVEVPRVSKPKCPYRDALLRQKDREMAFSFMQESQLEIESPHMDPAVVAVSSYAPPPPQIQSQPENNHVFNPAPPEGLNSIQSGMRDLNLNHMNSNSVDEEEDWEEKITSATYNNSSSVNGNVEGGDDNTNGYDRSGRGSFRGRGGRGRGRGNGFGNSRPPKGGRGFNHRGGYGGNFRAERTGQLDGAETSDFRGKGTRGFTRSFRGNGNAPPTSGGPPRRGRGAAKTFNGIHDVRSVEA